MTIIDMAVVFLVLYVLALIIKAIKTVVAPFGGGNGAKGSKAGARRDRQDEACVASGEAVAGVEVAGDEISAETMAVISAAIAAYLDRPESALVISAPGGQREESPWAMAGRTRIMQSRELAKRRATA